MDLDGWATQAEVAEHLGVSVRTVARLRAEGALAFRPGRPVRIQWRAVQAYLENSEVVSTWEGGVKQLLPVSSLTRDLLSTGPASGKSVGQRSMGRAILAHAVIRAARKTGK